MTPGWIGNFLRAMGGVLALLTLGVVMSGIWRGTGRAAGRKAGDVSRIMRSPWLYLVSLIVFLVISYWGWSPLPWVLSPGARSWMLGIGSTLYFPGMSFTLWGRLALGKNYFVSTGFGAQLFADHTLIRTGPYAIVRHPMYAGIMVSALGALLIYTTWTTVIFVCFVPLLGFRAYREEAALSAEFGGGWMDYCKRTPAFFPRLRR